MPRVPGLQALTLAMSCALAFGPVHAAKPGQEKAREPKEVEAGRSVFVEQCSLCHTTTAAVLFGPGLQGLMKHKEMVNGKPPTAANVKQLILDGQARMPRIPLDDARLDILVEYLKTL